VQALLFAVIALMLGFCMSIYDQWKCADDQHECDVWFGLYMFGFFKSSNWSTAWISFYFSFCWLVWTLLLAVFCYILISDDAYDVFSLNSLLSLPWFTPLARLTYNAYLVHIPLMNITDAYQRGTRSWQSWRVFLEVIGYIVLAYSVSFLLYLFVEKPIMNMVSTLLTYLKKSSSVQAHDDHRGLPLDREFSIVADPDNESIHLASPTHPLEDTVDIPSYARLSEDE